MVDMARERIVQRPEILSLVHGGLIGVDDRMEQTYRHDLLYEDVIDKRFGTFMAHRRVFPHLNIVLQSAIVPHVAPDPFGKFLMEIEIGGMFSLQGNQIAGE